MKERANYRLTEAQLAAALRLRYPAEAFALMFEVANETGGAKSRADAIAMGLWRSRGLTLRGFELKVTRSDWLRELKKPAKADHVGRYCAEWWVVAGHVELVKPEELPDTWGLLVPGGATELRVARHAKRALEPVAITPAFLAALLRAGAAGDVRANEELIRRARWKEREETEARERRKYEALEKSHRELLARVHDFEKAAGIAITGNWYGVADPKRVGRIVNEVLSGKHDPDVRRLREINTIARSIVEYTDTFLPEFEEAIKPDA